MILTGEAIQRAVDARSIEIDPFDPSRLNANSYDVRLGQSLLRYVDSSLDAREKNAHEELHLGPGGMALRPGEYYIGHVAEIIGSDYFVPMIHGKLQVARLGLFVHVTANLIDIGNHCNFSLHLYPTRCIRIVPGMVIAQVSFWTVQGTITLYQGKYKGVRGPAASQSFRHFQRQES